MGYSYRPLYWASVNKLLFYEKTNKLWRISFIAGILNVLLNIIFIPLYGIYAAAITTLLSLIYMGVSPFYLKEYREMENQNYFPIFWMIGIVMLTIIVFLLKDVSVFYKSFISLTLLSLFVFYLKGVKRKVNQINF